MKKQMNKETKMWSEKNKLISTGRQQFQTLLNAFHRWNFQFEIITDGGTYVLKQVVKTQSVSIVNVCLK